MGYLYTKDGALWFRSTDLGDDKDRVLIKSDGEYTYFASDVAYHWDKFQRVDHVIDIWGADHHGYIERVRCVCDALGYPGKFEVLLGQLVNLLRNGKPVRMSKRKGTMVTLQELVDEVGSDAARYTLISKSSNQMSTSTSRPLRSATTPTRCTTCSTLTPACAPSCAVPPTLPPSRLTRWA